MKGVMAFSNAAVLQKKKTFLKEPNKQGS